MGWQVIKLVWSVVLAVAFLAWAAGVAAQGDAQMSGVWKLNVAASTNPDGPAPPARPAGGGGGGTGGGGGGGTGGGGGGGTGGGGEGGGGGVSNSTDKTTLSGPEQQRFNAIKAMAFKAPPMMRLEATATDFKMLIDPEKKIGYLHKTDSKKQSLMTPSGVQADFKIKWDGKKLRREYETKDSFRCVEEYSLSPDGSQLIVTVKADSGMVRNVQLGEIKRVYDRQVQ